MTSTAETFDTLLASIPASSGSLTAQADGSVIFTRSDRSYRLHRLGDKRQYMGVDLLFAPGSDGCRPWSTSELHSVLGIPVRESWHTIQITDLPGGEPFYTDDACFERVNADDEDLLEEVRALEVGKTMAAGGGAVAGVEITRLAADPRRA